MDMGGKVGSNLSIISVVSQSTMNYMSVGN